MAAEHSALQARWTDDTHRLDALQSELTGARDALDQERTQRQRAEAEAARVSARLGATQELLERFSPASEPGPRPGKAERAAMK
ncbi:hypothetical protein INQ41_06955 [Lysobacter ciconiae]|uniref:Uncharacterized protein n=1 Tax=Novilysobacter ciconiae TaxID=2781022 RepID=A0A7S6ZR73_9GAMM|nr:hypothetical protein [Lysobacter ciconiae]QOW18468.1 hypothetical protein INQ41_06955 [Lysobacter ciconiae]